ncbi:MAG: hypothetical protein CMH58_01245 [Myxococcales bacterium]|nr:hypothetical protein [Myxococcales bacterium]
MRLEASLTNKPDKMEPCYWILTLILSVLTGFMGLDRFYLGYRLLGTLKLITLGGCGLWILYDIVMIVNGEMRDGLGRPLVR